MNKKNTLGIVNMLPRVWITRLDNTIIHSSITVQVCVSQKLGLVLAAAINPFLDVLTETFSATADGINILLTDDLGYISNTSKNFCDKYLENSINYDHKVNLSDIFFDWYNFTDEELAHGVKIKFSIN